MKQETLEEAAHRILTQYGIKSIGQSIGVIKVQELMVEMAKWQAERMYSEEDLISFAHFYFKEEFNSTMQTSKSTDEILQEWFKQFKKK